MTKIACLLLRIYVRRENTQTGIQLCFNLVFTTASQKSNLNRKIYVFRLFPTATSSSKVATLDEEAANLADNGRNSVIRKQRQELHKELQ